MSLHKLTAGDGYTYLTRQVAAQDATHRGYAGLGDYYAQRGESPGVWLGRGADGLSGFPADRQVTEAQMTALFGEGRHPDAAAIEAQLVAAGHGVPAVLAATRLGSPYRVFTGPGQWRTALAVRFEGWNDAAGLPRDWPVPEAERARIRSELGRELFGARYRRPPADARELAGFIAKASRQQSTAVAGYDLTFTPVKSVSAFWAVAPRADAQIVEQAHAQAVEQTLGWLEDNAAYTRLGRNGVRQVDVRGLIAAAFTHRDSRCGDPNLHTHVAVSNKVQVAGGPDGGGLWGALDGRPVHKLAVAASERYNTRLEALLTERLGVRFADRPDPAGKRPVREIVGVDGRLTASWSARRAAIDVRRAELAARFQADHGRPPGPIEAVKLAQRATLETRQAKHEPRSHVAQRALWREQAVRLLGGPGGLQAMLHAARHPSGRNRQAVQVTPTWVADTAQTVLATVQSSRASWQQAHIRAEAERRVRPAQLTPAQVDAAVERIVAAALAPDRSLPLGVAEPVSEPAVLRRKDGSSMYATAGMQLYTSPPVVAAERALLAAARRTDGRTASATSVDLAITESAARGVPLNPGQASLVRQLATSGARLQLALAPAGTGKTTALAVLARAWTGDGGTVIGLAPSAAAASVLGAELGHDGRHAPTDTLAKLLDGLDRLDPAAAGGRAGSPDGTDRVPGWVRQIGPDSLVVIDEAGMAGTPELARAVRFVIGRGGSVRLVGDDCQLAAIGAGGVLRDLADTVGAVTLSQVVRFTDPAEGAASLALRAGQSAAIGFYLDNRRVHVGDAGTVVEQAYAAWAADRAAGLDALLLAPTRQVAAALNGRARADRLAADRTADQPPHAAPAGREVQLADGSAAGAGDTVITRRNNRRLAISATDWVKNGDRWTVEQVLTGGLQVTHLATRRRILLPASYTAEHVELGYASTVHAAQGSTAQVCHTVASGAESRQLLYVAMTRGRAGNHLYLSSAGDGDEHSVITPDALHPPTAVDLLDRILARDGAQTSASTAQRHLADPAVRLGAAAGRFYDSLTVGCETHLGPQRMAAIDAAADSALPGLTASPAWPTLRGHLALLAVDGHDPGAAVTAAIGSRETDSALDPAAVLDWRLDRTGSHCAQVGPLPWLPAIPAALAADPTWADYLTGRDRHTRELTDTVAQRARGWTPTSAPGWAQPLVGTDQPTPGTDRPGADLLARLAVWRAAQGVADTDLRPTGPPRLAATDRRAQQALDAAVHQALGDPASAAGRWRTLAEQIEPRITCDPFWPQLADRFAAADRAGIDIAGLARAAGAHGPLPDELPAAALWWRLSRHLAPAALHAHHHDTVGPVGGGTASTLRPPWTAALVELIGPAAGRRVLADPAWPALVAAVTAASRTGWTPEQVLPTAYHLLGGTDAADEQTGRALRPGELATALIWRIGMLTDPEPLHPDDLAVGLIPPDPAREQSQPPADLYDGIAQVPIRPGATPTADPADKEWVPPPEPPTDEPEADHHSAPVLPGDPAGVDDNDRVDPAPDRPAGHPRGNAPKHDPDRDDGPAWLPWDRDPAHPAGQTRLWQPDPDPAVPRQRLLELNRQAAAFFAAGYPHSWAAEHLRERLGTDLTDDPRFAPGYAPAGWTALTEHLRALGATDTELLAAGLASTARTGRLIDRFRDRLILPIQAPGPDGTGQIIAFIGRRNPDTPDAGPKYLNTADTAVFSKGAQLYGMAEGAAELAGGASPVLVEGPLDAIAVTLAAQGTAVGVAPLGTAFTDTQADQLRPYLGPGRPGVVVATDGDEAGQKAAVRAYWQLTARGGNPSHLVMPDGHDPASLLHSAGPAALRLALVHPPTLARTLIDARVGQFADRMHHAEGPGLAVRSAAEAIGALPPEHWLAHIDYLNSIVQTMPGESHLAVLDAGHAWTADPDGLTRTHLAERSIPTRPQTPHRQQTVADPDQEAPEAAGEAAAPPAGTTHRDVDLREQWAADGWVDVGRSIDPALVAGADWSGLAAALDRASRAGYDVQQHLPRLAARSPLPETRPARALHYRLVEECAAAITPMPPLLRRADDEQRAAAALARLKTEADLHDNQPAAVPDPTPPPTTGALHAAQERMRAQGRRLDNERPRNAPAGPPADRAPADRGTTSPRPTSGADRPLTPTDRRRPPR